MSSVDVVLVRPRDFGAVPPGALVQDPLGVGILAAVLRQRGRRVVVLDAHALDLDDAGLVAAVGAIGPTAVGLSLHSFADYGHCVRISEGLRRLPDPPLCAWGGEHATFLAREILDQHPEVDAVVLGEGEETIVELVERATSGERPLRRPVAGAVVRLADGAVANGEPRPALSDLTAWPPPAKDVVESALRSGKQVSLSLLTGRGCVHRCLFCTAHDFLRLGGGSVWRRLPPARVADELERLRRRYLGHSLVHPVVNFQDVIFLGTSRAAQAWAREFVQELKRRQLMVPFYCMTRADSILANRDLLPELVEVGLWSVEVGIESGVERILSRYNKRNSVAENESAVRLLREHGITFDASGYIMFDPDMTLDELRENARYLSRFGAATWDFFVTRLQLYPGTELRRLMISQGRFDPRGDLGRTSGYDFADAQVGAVAEHAVYYDLGIRKLDLRLRDAKALLAQDVRAGRLAHPLLTGAVALVHDTYLDHLLALCDLAEAGQLGDRPEALIHRFLGRVETLNELLAEVVAVHYGAREPGRVRDIAQPN